MPRFGAVCSTEWDQPPREKKRATEIRSAIIRDIFSGGHPLGDNPWLSPQADIRSETHSKKSVKIVAADIRSVLIHYFSHGRTSAPRDFFFDETAPRSDSYSVHIPEFFFFVSELNGWFEAFLTSVDHQNVAQTIHICRIRAFGFCPWLIFLEVFFFCHFVGYMTTSSLFFLSVWRSKPIGKDKMGKGTKIENNIPSLAPQCQNIEYSCGFGKKDLLEKSTTPSFCRWIIWNRSRTHWSTHTYMHTKTQTLLERSPQTGRQPIKGATPYFPSATPSVLGEASAVAFVGGGTCWRVSLQLEVGTVIKRFEPVFGNPAGVYEWTVFEKKNSVHLVGLNRLSDNRIKPGKEKTENRKKTAEPDNFFTDYQPNKTITSTTINIRIHPAIVS